MKSAFIHQDDKPGTGIIIAWAADSAMRDKTSSSCLRIETEADGLGLFLPSQFLGIFAKHRREPPTGSGQRADCPAPTGAAAPASQRATKSSTSLKPKYVPPNTAANRGWELRHAPPAAAVSNARSVA